MIILKPLKLFQIVPCVRQNGTTDTIQENCFVKRNWSALTKRVIFSTWPDHFISCLQMRWLRNVLSSNEKYTMVYKGRYFICNQRQAYTMESNNIVSMYLSIKCLLGFQHKLRKRCPIRVPNPSMTLSSKRSRKITLNRRYSQRTTKKACFITVSKGADLQNGYQMAKPIHCHVGVHRQEINVTMHTINFTHKYHRLCCFQKLINSQSGMRYRKIA